MSDEYLDGIMKKVPATTDTDKIEELAKWHYEKYLYASRNNNSIRADFHFKQGSFLRSLSATIKGLREARDALEWLEKYTNLKAVILSTQISETGVPPKIPPYLQKRLGKEG